MCIWSTIVHGPVCFRDDPALRYRSAQTRLFGIHKEQQSASREKYAPVVGTAARARGQRHVPVNLASVWVARYHSNYKTLLFSVHSVFV